MHLFHSPPTILAQDTYMAYLPKSLVLPVYPGMFAHAKTPMVTLDSAVAAYRQTINPTSDIKVDAHTGQAGGGGRAGDGSAGVDGSNSVGVGDSDRGSGVAEAAAAAAAAAELAAQAAAAAELAAAAAAAAEASAASAAAGAAAPW